MWIYISDTLDVFWSISNFLVFLTLTFILAVEHNVGVPTMMGTRRGVAFPGGDGCILSPRDAAGLGVKMVEYVLGGSPTGNKRK